MSLRLVEFGVACARRDVRFPLPGKREPGFGKPEIDPKTCSFVDAATDAKESIKAARAGVLTDGEGMLGSARLIENGFYHDSPNRQT